MKNKKNNKKVYTFVNDSTIKSIKDFVGDLMLLIDKLENDLILDEYDFSLLALVCRIYSYGVNDER